MKKISFIISLFFIGNALVFAQSEFSDFEDHKDVNSVVINKKMFEMMGNVKIDASNAEDQAYFKLIKKLDLLKVFSTSNNTAIHMQLLEASEQFISKKGLQELTNQVTNEHSTKFYTNPGAQTNAIKELLMINQDENQTSVMYLSGDFALEEITTLTNKMNLTSQH